MVACSFDADQEDYCFQMRRFNALTIVYWLRGLWQTLVIDATRGMYPFVHDK